MLSSSPFWGRNVGQLERIGIPCLGGKGGKSPAPLEEARHRNQELCDVADQVAQRLDRAVGRINAILES